MSLPFALADGWRDPPTLLQSEALVHRPWTFERLFFQHFQALRAVRESCGAAPGFVGVPIFDNTVLGASAILLLRAPTPAHCVLGRHSRAGLVLDGDPTVALRHVAVRLRGDGSVVTTDLCTGQGFDVAGEGRCGGAVTEGMLGLRLGAHAVFFLPTDGEPWPPDALDTWDLLSAERRTIAVTRAPARNRIRVLRGGAAPGPVGGYVSMLTPNVGCVHVLTMDELRRGVLVGRSSRCDIYGVGPGAGEAVSRVHAMLLWDNGPWLLDLASKNGVRLDGRRIRTAPLPRDASLELGRGCFLRWRST